MDTVIIDRRANPAGKSLSNRQRFLKRAKSHVDRAVRDASGKKDITDILGGGSIKIPVDDISEPTFQRGNGGIHDRVLPGNDQFATGDTIERPQGGQGKGAGEGGLSGPDADDFSFILTREEFLDLFMQDLELPDMTKKSLVDVEIEGIRRAGFSTTGSPANLSVPRTAKRALGRRIALGRPNQVDVAELEAQIAVATGSEKDTLIALLEKMKGKMKRVPFIDHIDLQFNRFETYPKPMSQALMLCLMDVSGSMSEHRKDLAKRFFMLLYVFLHKHYEKVDVKFIRHTTEASLCDEQTFFYGTESGGTIVSSALEESVRFISENYNVNEWNVYITQASDGDNSPGDEHNIENYMKVLSPLVQYFAYLEVSDEDDYYRRSNPNHKTSLWRTYEGIVKTIPMSMRRVVKRSDIFPVFQDLFRKRQEPAT